VRSSSARLTAILSLVLGIVLGAPVLSGASVTALNTNQIIYQPGDQFVLTLLLSVRDPREAEQARGDLYVQVTGHVKHSVEFVEGGAPFS